MENKDNGLERLKNLVNDLVNKTERSDIVKALQKIGEYILQNCYFEFEKGKQIYPLWIEAYYYNKNTFPDDFCHKNAAQKGEVNFGKAYYHSGVDVCLSLGDYYLSFLIKASEDANGEKYSQTELADSITERNDNQVIVFNNNNGKKVENYYRVGLSCEHDMEKLRFQECLLSSFFDEDIEKTLTKIPALKKESFILNYVKTHIDDFKGTSEEILAKAKEKFGYKPEKLLLDDSHQLKTVFPLSYEEFIEQIKKGAPNDSISE